MTAVLVIETSSITVELVGPLVHPRGVLIDGDSPRYGRCDIKLGPDEQLVAAEWLPFDDDSAPRIWEKADLHGPRIFAETDYRLTVTSKNGQTPEVRNRDPNLLASMSAIRAHPATCTGNLNFKNQLGTAPFSIVVGGRHALMFSVEVFPTKISYEAEYRDLLCDVTRTSRALAIEYLRATHQSGSTTDEGPPASRLEWLTLVRNEVDRLELALTHISASPHRVLDRSVTNQRLERIKRSSSVTRRAIARGRGHGPSVSFNGIRTSSWVPAQTAVETLDTPEHRWLRRQLVAVQQSLACIDRGIVDEINQTLSLRGVHNAARAKAELVEVRCFESQVETMLGLYYLVDATAPPPHGFVSLTLMGRPGYREAYRSLLTLRLGLMPVGGAQDLSVTDLEKLYETWCFIQVATIVHNATGANVVPANAFPISEYGLRVNLSRGEESRIELDHHGTAISIVNNRQFTGDTGAQKPDIVIDVRHPGWPPIFLIMDAKYRVDASEQYRQQFGGYGPPAPAVNALHRYRDAITLRGPLNGRPVVKGVALFPLSKSLSGNFEEHKLWGALQNLGVGALPFLPGNTEWVSNWVESFINLPPELMADMGPPFLAHEHERGH